MAYYLAIIQNDETCALFKYADYDAALAQMHTELAYRGTEDQPRTQTLCVIIGSDGTIPNLEHWKKKEVAG